MRFAPTHDSQEAFSLPSRNKPVSTCRHPHVIHYLWTRSIWVVTCHLPQTDRCYPPSCANIIPQLNSLEYSLRVKPRPSNQQRRTSQPFLRLPLSRVIVPNAWHPPNNHPPKQSTNPREWRVLSTLDPPPPANSVRYPKAKTWVTEWTIKNVLEAQQKKRNIMHLLEIKRLITQDVKRSLASA